MHENIMHLIIKKYTKKITPNTLAQKQLSDNLFLELLDELDDLAPVRPVR